MIESDRQSPRSVRSEFPAAPVLADVAELARLSERIDWSGTAIVCVQHLLASTGSLIETLISLGVSPTNIMVCGKGYSTNPDVAALLRERGVHVLSPATSGRTVGFQITFRQDVDTLWAYVRTHPCLNEWRQIVVLDDGGHCIDRAPDLAAIRDKLTGVEQTTAGIRKVETIGTVPVVNVAQSAAKTLLESPLICELILKRAHQYLTSNPRVGVVGVGNIGGALVMRLSEAGYRVSCFDKDSGAVSLNGSIPARFRAHTLPSLIDESDVIFGCTGADALGTDWLDALQHDLTLISCSSEDLEFRPLITLLYKRGRIGGREQTEDVRVNIGQASLTIARGGFPVNFDGSEESVPTVDIQLTRGLLLGGIVQALTPGCRPGISMLSPSIQRYVVQSWFRHRPERSSGYAVDVVRSFSDLDWIHDHSLGHSYPEQNGTNVNF